MPLNDFIFGKVKDLLGCNFTKNWTPRYFSSIFSTFRKFYCDEPCKWLFPLYFRSTWQLSLSETFFFINDYSFNESSDLLFIYLFSLNFSWQNHNEKIYVIKSVAIYTKHLLICVNFLSGTCVTKEKPR